MYLNTCNKFMYSNIPTQPNKYSIFVFCSTTHTCSCIAVAASSADWLALCCDNSRNLECTMPVYNKSHNYIYIICVHNFMSIEAHNFNHGCMIILLQWKVCYDVSYTHLCEVSAKLARLSAYATRTATWESVTKKFWKKLLRTSAILK